MTSLPIFIKFSQKRKASGRFGFFFFIIIFFFRVSELFPGFGVRQQNIYCTLWYISNEIVFPFHSRLQTPPPFYLGRRVYQVGRFLFCQSQQLRQRHPSSRTSGCGGITHGTLGSRGGGPGWTWHPLLSSFLWATVQPPASPSQILQMAARSPCPSGSPHAPSRAPHPRMASVPATNYSPDKRGLLASRKGLGGRRQDGEVAHPPLPAGAKGQRGQNREAGRPASCPAHSSFPYRFYRSAAGSNMATSH